MRISLSPSVAGAATRGEQTARIYMHTNEQLWPVIAALRTNNLSIGENVCSEVRVHSIRYTLIRTHVSFSGVCRVEKYLAFVESFSDEFRCKVLPDEPGQV